MSNVQKFYLRVSMLILFPLLAVASDLTISDVELVYHRDTSKELSVRFTVQWNHAWHNEKNHDAAWMVIKFLRGENGYRHALIAEKGHAILRNNLSDGSNPIITVSSDRTGLFIYPGAKHRGPVNWTIRIVLDPAILYAAFLNSLSGEQTQFRANFGGKGYYRLRGTIKIENDRYVAGAPNRPCNFLSWDDGCAFADWAALRPMTELEFTKACRGPSAPIPHEYPWGTSSKDNLARVVSENDDLVMSNGMDEGQLTDQNREVFGASFYWVMDLAGSLWERAITVGHPLGRKFAGTHGDGEISWYGFATNDDWPKGDTEAGGFGFRGGGYYTHRQAYSEFNPHSPIAYRRYGAWSGGNRTDAYSSRFVRTAP